MRQAYDEIATLFRAMPSTAGGAKHRPTTRALPAALARSTTPAMVGRARVELATSRLSGVRSNHLSYRPAHAAPSVAAKPRLMAQLSRAGRACLRAK